MSQLVEAKSISKGVSRSHEVHKDPEGAKLGMWLFLVTELLLFAGLFLVYSVYTISSYCGIPFSRTRNPYSSWNTEHDGSPDKQSHHGFVDRRAPERKEVAFGIVLIVYDFIRVRLSRCKVF